MLAASVSGVWYARASWYRGNPVYPFFDQFARGQGPPAMRDSKTPLAWRPNDLAGAPWQACVSSDPSQVLALMAGRAGDTTLHLVNLTPTAKTIDLRGLEPLSNAGSTVLAPYAVETVALTR